MLYLKSVAHLLMMNTFLRLMTLLKMYVRAHSKKISTHNKMHHPMRKKEKKEKPLSYK